MAIFIYLCDTGSDCSSKHIPEEVALLVDWLRGPIRMRSIVSIVMLIKKMVIMMFMFMIV